MKADRISKHISLREATFSSEAMRKNIVNIPNAEHIMNMRYVADKCFEPLREWAGHPIAVNSFFRSPKVNVAVGGSATSHHCVGAAIDMDADNYDDVPNSRCNAELFLYALENLPFTEMIWEYGDNLNPSWVHIACIEGRENEKNVKIKRKGENYKKFDIDIDSLKKYHGW